WRISEEFPRERKMSLNPALMVTFSSFSLERGTPFSCLFEEAKRNPAAPARSKQRRSRQKRSRCRRAGNVFILLGGTVFSPRCFNNGRFCHAGTCSGAPGP